jgi:GNAT superfamily N-acetyltransferase
MKSNPLNRLDTLEIHPVTPDRWPDMQKLFGSHGAYSGCWCMWWRIPASQFSLGGESNRKAMEKLIEGGTVPGLLAYLDGEPAGWISVGPREDYGRLERSRTLKRLDDQPVWSIVCFYIAKPYRGRGLMQPLIRAAVDYARERGAKVIEAYPVDPAGRVSADSLFTGLAKVFAEIGFVEMTRPNPQRPILRFVLS